MAVYKILPSSIAFIVLLAIYMQGTASAQGYYYETNTWPGQTRDNTGGGRDTTNDYKHTTEDYEYTTEGNIDTTKVPSGNGVTDTTGNSQNLLLEILKQQNQTVRVQECQASTLAKLTSGNDVSKVCASIKQFKEILDDKCVKTEYDLVVVETMQLFNCLVCPH